MLSPSGSHGLSLPSHPVGSFFLIFAKIEILVVKLQFTIDNQTESSYPHINYMPLFDSPAWLTNCHMYAREHVAKAASVIMLFINSFRNRDVCVAKTLWWKMKKKKTFHVLYMPHMQIHVLMHINQCLICTLARGLGKNIVKTALSHVDIRPFFGTQPKRCWGYFD